VRIGVDLLGSENTPEALLEAALSINSNIEFQLHAFGPKLSRHSNVIWHESEYCVSMNDVGVNSAKSKDTSMYNGIMALKEGKIDAFISCGNTAALLTYSHLLLNKFPGVKRQGLLAHIGTLQGMCYVIDVGANINPSVFQLSQFCLMGAATFKALHNKEPRIGILNIASEKGKGPKSLIELYKLLEKYPSFVGFVEPSSIFEGKCDLVVTDGFSGNILLKTAEAVAQMTLGATLATSQYNPSSYPGALLCGAEHLVMKCHGVGNTRALQKTIEEACRLYSRNYITRVKQEISALKEESF
jgi:phosphate acyltransferase